MILPGLRSEEMEKEKNTRENKSQSNVNTGKDRAELSLTLEKASKYLLLSESLRQNTCTSEGHTFTHTG